AEYGLCPQIAIVTNLSPDHLNRYGTMEEYAEAKRGIVRGQGAEDIAILNRDDAIVWGFRGATGARVLSFGRDDPGGDGAWLGGDWLRWRYNGAEHAAARATLRLPGEHNANNALAAGLAVLARGAPFGAIETSLAEFAGVKDRLESLAEIDG